MGSPLKNSTSTNLAGLKWIRDESHRLTGVQFTERHNTMIESRIQSRLHALELDSISDYIEYYQRHQVEEEPFLIGLATTHHTYFFREYLHFELLEQKIIQELITAKDRSEEKVIRIWSAACSRGQEVYSLAMHFNRILKSKFAGWSFTIHGTDIDPESVRIAQNSVYPLRELRSLPQGLLQSYWSVGTGEISDYARAKKEIRERCTFSALNLLEPLKYPNEKYDVIFCRNVFIYFDTNQISQITRSLSERLTPSGRLFVGISESLHGLDLNLSSFGPSVYGRAESRPSLEHAQSQPASPPPETTKPLRVFCIDDSVSVHALLKKLLTPELGVEIVGTALNGKDAAEKLRSIRPDVITLDIHMPEMDGITYLKSHFGPNHPPVIMLSSVSPEHGELATDALRLGASDFVQKPSLQNFKSSQDELVTKLRAAARGSKLSAATAFKKPVSTAKDLSSAHCIIVCPPNERTRILEVIRSWGSARPQFHVLWNCEPTVATSLEKWLKEAYPGTIQSGCLTKDSDALRGSFGDQPTSILVLGTLHNEAWMTLARWPKAQILAEDLADHAQNKTIRKIASDIFPLTSFTYVASEYLCRKIK